MIRVSGLEKKFGRQTVLNGIELDIAEGGIYAILGPNGSGKTTLIKCILGLTHPNEGEIFIHDKAVRGKWKYRNAINYLPQIANFPENLRVKELFSMIKDIRQSPGRDERLIEIFNLEPYLNKKLSTLSGGTVQKVNLVLTFMFDSPIVILDEPTSGLDPLAMLKLKELIRQERAAGKTLIITTHIMQFVEEVSDRIVYLLEGKIYYSGSVQGLLEKTQQQDLEHAIAHITKQELYA
ncbi:Cu-processing system ATP-binding protein [Robiginitalea myxolifaciens]|uniref:Cu-processing system ATP-binding protein n=1 Tax=Robiginitalea myxolifaciens TaxID=400055 RepID=A0A1I6FYF5_9FLAO|nr:ABC transporter ATP-binding protein [Robiginitalea myxolifaciens]SFR34930.1 Cu-processing system ATP-binding protein [Robiginitalea myxolifaciens]